MASSWEVVVSKCGLIKQKVSCGQCNSEHSRVGCKVQYAALEEHAQQCGLGCNLCATMDYLSGLPDK